MGHRGVALGSDRKVFSEAVGRGSFDEQLRLRCIVELCSNRVAIAITTKKLTRFVIKSYVDV